MSNIKYQSVRNSLNFSNENIYFNGKKLIHYAAGNFIFRLNNRNTKTKCEISSKLAIRTLELRQNDVRTSFKNLNKGMQEPF